MEYCYYCPNPVDEPKGGRLYGQHACSNCIEKDFRKIEKEKDEKS